MNIRRCLHLVAGVLFSVMLSACGGGSDKPNVPQKPSVTGVSIDQLVYRKVSIMTIKGQNLDLGFNISNPICLTITELPGGNSTQRVFSCKVVNVGILPLSITAGDGSNLHLSNLNVPLAAQPQVTMGTSMGNIVIELNPAKAPVTVDNFLNYVESGFFVNKIFHRVIKNFIIQGGGLTADMKETSNLTKIKFEGGNGLSNLRGSIAMARVGTDLNSATSQFFINTVDNQSLDTNSGGYAVFGKVVSGLDVVDRMQVVPTAIIAGYADTPITPILITTALQTK
jgi:peptidyl-prolyl cis-trans isomerase A (cyclophilin A)